MLTEKEITRTRKILSETDENVAAMFKVLGEVNRYRIFRILTQQPQISVSNIARILNISLPLTSQHIKILVHANLVQKERDGKKVFTKLECENPFTRTIIKAIKQTIK